MTMLETRAPQTDVGVFETTESDVRTYCRTFPAVFGRAKGARLYAEDGSAFVDFFCGASALNYGHNDEAIKTRLLEYLAADGVMHALDMYTTAKRDFLVRLREVVLEPRALDYKVQFCGPTGADAVEAATKLARKATGRRGLVAFAGSYHGVTAGSMAPGATSGCRFALNPAFSIRTGGYHGWARLSRARSGGARIIFLVNVRFRQLTRGEIAL